MSLRILNIFLTLLLVLAPRAAIADTPPPPVLPREQHLTWNNATSRDQQALLSLLQAPDWPFRVFGLLRLERYAVNASIADLLSLALKDDAWQVRCFALRTHFRANLPIDAALFANESNPRVLRMAVRCGVALDQKSLARVAASLMRHEAMDERLLGMEIAAASGNKTLRQEALQRAELLLRNMNDLVAHLASRRLASLLNATPTPRSLDDWRTWYAAKEGKIALAPPEMLRRELLSAPPSRIASFDDESIVRLRDYLDGLKQRDLETALVMDATASMIPMVNEARAAADGLILFVQDLARSYRFAFIAYRDHDNQPVWDGVPLTTDVPRIRRYLFDLRITGGADLPEAVYEGLAACTQLDWSHKAHKQIVLIGDARPHSEDAYRISALLDAIVHRGIVVHAAHIPMRIFDHQRARMSESQLKEIEDHNTMTATAFQEIAETGGGRMVHLRDASELVPAIMRCTIDEAWWLVFDEFYEAYIQSCR